MNDLLKKKCVPCEGGVTPFDISEIHKYQKKVDGWEVIKNFKEIYCLEKNFKFKDFQKSQDFVIQVGKISEQEGHHPDINYGWGYAKIIITTLSKYTVYHKVDQLYCIVAIDSREGLFISHAP